MFDQVRDASSTERLYKQPHVAQDDLHIFNWIYHCILRHERGTDFHLQLELEKQVKSYFSQPDN
jgi:hypothetical protein